MKFIFFESIFKIFGVLWRELALGRLVLLDLPSFGGLFLGQ